MSKLTEQEICASFIGRRISPENLARCAQKNRTSEKGTEYIVYSCGFLYDQELMELFGVTAKLKDLWERRGTEFNVHLYIADGSITATSIFKYSESGGARPNMTTPACTQQELRIARRILDYLTT